MMENLAGFSFPTRISISVLAAAELLTAKITVSKST
uniref:Uncharacterized protein n=1 Tax=Rhizophora mucronata TaxID=61149 RepID=A0A2P2PZQ0_RHIMU